MRCPRLSLSVRGLMPRTCARSLRRSFVFLYAGGLYRCVTLDSLAAPEAARLRRAPTVLGAFFVA
jgi:hypothetical protein